MWPPAEIIFPRNIGPYITCSEKHGVWAAVFEGGKGQENRLMVSRAPLDVNSWGEIPFPINPLKHTEAREMGCDWLLFMQAYSRHDERDNLAFWNRLTGAWHELPVGAFGKARVRECCCPNDGNVLFEVTGTQGKLCRVAVAALFDFLAVQKKKVHAPPQRAF